MLVATARSMRFLRTFQPPGLSQLCRMSGSQPTMLGITVISQLLFTGYFCRLEITVVGVGLGESEGRRLGLLWSKCFCFFFFSFKVVPGKGEHYLFCLTRSSCLARLAKRSHCPVWLQVPWSPRTDRRSRQRSAVAEQCTLSDVIWTYRKRTACIWREHDHILHKLWWG